MTNRRNFLELGAGALIAQCLPVMAASERSKIQIWFAKEPDRDALMDMPVMKGFSPTKLEIRVGATKPFRMLHFSDSHIAWMNSHDLMKCSEGELKWYEGRRRHFATNATGLAAALAYARANRLHMLHTGDLVDYLSDANLNYVRRDLEGLDCQFALGNHELAGIPSAERPGPKPKFAEMRESIKPYFPNGVVCHSHIINGVNFVAFDNCGMSADVFDEQFAAIRAEFEKGLPVVIAYHIPFYTEALGEEQVKAVKRMKTHADITEAYLAAPPNGRGLKINRTLREWLPKQKNLKAMLCGHKHAESKGLFCENVTQYVAGATYKGNAYDIQFI